MPTTFALAIEQPLLGRLVYLHTTHNLQYTYSQGSGWQVTTLQYIEAMCHF